VSVITAIDPGPRESAYVTWRPDPPRVLAHGIDLNGDIRQRIRNGWDFETDRLAIECIVSSRGMPVGAETFTTVRWVGIFEEAWGREELNGAILVPRDKVKLHLCGQMKARDSNIRQALIDRFGASGTKKQPGILYGLRRDEWAALAVAVYVADMEAMTCNDAQP